MTTRTVAQASTERDRAPMTAPDLSDQRQQAEQLLLIADDPVHADDAERVRTAILADGRAHGGSIDSNRVRESLRNRDALGNLDVQPRVIGAVYSALRSQGLIIRRGYLTSTDNKGGNAGKPVPHWFLTDAGYQA